MLFTFMRKDLRLLYVLKVKKKMSMCKRLKDVGHTMESYLYFFILTIVIYNIF